ncbi:MAG: tRNA epoxyqueuosine(34) reductase QueG [Muribaculaceae bacterium]|nr:tRNA epoxyqueuosine(34) reductase QueG [Muribaculaceae bacterium]
MTISKHELRHLCLEAGACAAGFAAVHPVPEHIVDGYRRWIADGHHAGMDYLERYDDVRHSPALLLPGARTMLCCAFAYTAPGYPRSPLFADYALGADYHTVLRKALRPVAETMEAAVPGSLTRICIDTAPLRERYWATEAGLGFVADNNQLIVPGVGSHVFLAEILWTAEVAPDAPCREECLHCGACRRACPGRALEQSPRALDARRCLSYLTIEHRGELPADLTLPSRLYGCDICRDVCPLDKGRPATVLPQFEPAQALLALTAGDVAALDADSFSRLFSKSAVKRAKLEGLRRNALCKLRRKDTEQ